MKQYRFWCLLFSAFLLVSCSDGGEAKVNPGLDLQELAHDTIGETPEDQNTPESADDTPTDHEVDPGDSEDTSDTSPEMTDTSTTDQPDEGSDDDAVDQPEEITEDTPEDLGVCQIALPERPSMAPLDGANPGRFETTNTNGFTDEYLYSEGDFTKIGVRQEWGGTVVFFGLSNNTGPGFNSSNVIDANDTGREVQVAFYDPDRIAQSCAHNASCASSASSCPNSITYLGWNPVQGGNRCNKGSGIDSLDTSTPGTLKLVTTPLHWNPNWERQDCESDVCSNSSMNRLRSEVEVTQSLRFINPHIVELAYVLFNDADMDHRATGHELPTVYTSNGQQGPDLWRFMDSNGTQHAIDQPANDGFFYKPITSPGGWVSMQDETMSYGVGMYYENRLTGFTGWQNRNLPFNNFRSNFSFAIPAYGTIEARAYLILGSQGTVATEAQWLDENLAPFGVMDVPAWDTTLSGVQTVRGWALDNRGVTKIELWVDGAYATDLNYGTSRPDVCLVWPGYANCSNVGYQGSYDFSGLSGCQHLLEVKATDTHGNIRVIARNRVTIE